MTSPQFSPQASRRSVLAAAAWSVPAVSIASAAPAFAQSGTWSIASDSWRGSTDGTRSLLSRYVFNLTISAPANADLSSVTATLALGLSPNVSAQIGGTVSGNVVGWTTDRQDPEGIEFATFVFTSGAIPAGTTKNLQFELDGVGYTSDFQVATLSLSAPGQTTAVLPVSSLNQGEVSGDNKSGWVTARTV